MSIQNLMQAFDLIDQNEDIKYVSGNKAEDLIKKAEDALNYIFPNTYRLFLKNYGFGGIGSLEINGLINEDLEKPGDTNVVWFSLEERKSGMPKTFIIISSTGFGPQYVLDSSQSNQEGEYPVLLWLPGDPLNTTEKIAEDFGEFLLQQVQQALDEDEDEK